MSFKLPFAKKSLGQHWLADPLSLQAMCDSADVAPTDTVLEVGPGLGTLTQLLVAQAGRVVAVELDTVLVHTLPGRIPVANLEVIEGDILRFDLTKLPPGYKVIANIPYYLTSNLIRVLSESSNPPVCAVLLVQKEVAERVTAGPGDLSILAVTAQYYWDVSVGRIVSAALFTPPPMVDSQILILHRRPGALYPDVDPKVFFRVVKAGFAQRRKTLLNSLSSGLQLNRSQTGKLLSEARITPSTRAQVLALDDWYRLYQRYVVFSRLV